MPLDSCGMSRRPGTGEIPGNLPEVLMCEALREVIFGILALCALWACLKTGEWLDRVLLRRFW
jgi:hypothetical protein